MERTVSADESVSVAVVCAVSELEGRPVTDLPPLHETLDGDALDALIHPKTGDGPRFDGSVSFGYSDSSVVVWSDRSITVSAFPENGNKP